MAIQASAIGTSKYYEDGFGNKITVSGRPSDFIDPNKKGKEWILAMVKAIYIDYNRFYPNMFFNNRNAWDENMMYLQGLINPAKFMNRNDQNTQVAKDNSEVNYDKRFLNIVSKYFRILKGRLSEVKFDITASPDNVLARNHQKEYVAKLNAAIEAGKLAEMYSIGPLRQVLEEMGFGELPEDDIELQIKLNESLPAQAAMNIELYLKWIAYIGNLDLVLSEADQDLIAYGVQAAKEVLDGNGNPITQRVDPRNLLCGWSNTEDFRDVNEIGEFRMINTNDIKKEDVNNDLSYDDLCFIEESLVNRYGNSTFYPDTQARGYRGIDTTFAKTRVLVLDLFFYSWDEYTYVAKNNKDGNRRVSYVDKFDYYRGRENEYKSKYPDRNLYRTRTKNVYKCSWIVGTDLMYNFGKLRDMPRTKNDPVDTKLPIIIDAPLMRNGRSISIIDEIKPIADSANLKWKKMQEAIAHARPPGFQFDVDSLYDAIKGMAADGYNFERVMELMMKHNIIPVSTKSIGGYASGARPFEERYGGLGPDFKGWYEGLTFDLQLMQEITGFSNAASGGDVQYTGKDVARLASQTADYSIKHLYDGKRNFYQSIMQMKAILGMDSIAQGKAKGIREGLGGVMEFFEINKNTSLYDYAILIRFRANEADWADLARQVEIASNKPLDQGGITILDAMRIKECETIKQARMYLYTAIKKNMREAKKAQQELQVLKAKLDQESAAQAQQASQQALAMQLEMDRQKAAIAEEAKRQTNYEQFGYNLELAKLNGLIKSDHITTQGQIDEYITRVQAKYNMDKMRPKNVIQTKSK